MAGFRRMELNRDLGDRLAPFNRARRGGGHDRQEIRGLEAGAADQCTVDIGDSKYLRSIRRLDRTAIEDSDLRAACAKRLFKLAADFAVHFPDFFEGRDLAGADGPD